MGCGAHSQAQESIQRGSTYSVSLVRTRHVRLGISLGHCNGFPCVSRIFDNGLVFGWNERYPSMEVLRGDHVLSVNGVGLKEQGFDAIIAEFFKLGDIILLMERPPEHIRCHNIETMGQYDSSAGDRLAALPLVSAENDGDLTCCVCLESLDSTSELVKLVCGHVPTLSIFFIFLFMSKTSHASEPPP